MIASEKADEFRDRLAAGKFRVASFDVFDTLIYRPTSRPDHLYQIIGREAQSVCEIGVSQFAHLRRRAENEVRVKARFAGREEVDLDEIYRRFCELINLSPDMLHELVEIEERVELENFLPSDLGRQLVATAREHGLKIAFVSDTYYSAAFMKRVIASFMQDDDLLIVSSAEGRTKHTGSIFSILVAAVATDAIIHIGDNLSSDIRNALKVGLNVFHVSSGSDAAASAGYRFAAEKPSLVQSLAQGLVNQNMFREENDSFRDRLRLIGYNVLGPFWIGFSAFIREQVERDGAEKVFFLARDGFIMKKAYEAQGGVDCAYLSVSRRTLYLSYAHIDFDAALPSLLQNYSNATIGEVLGRLMPDDIDLTTLPLPSWASGALSRNVIDTKSYDLLQRLARLLTEHIRASAASQFESLTGYLMQEGFGNFSRIAVVDLGWHGSMQVILQHVVRAMKLRIHMTGIYAGLFAHAKKPIGTDRMTGYLFEYGSNHAAEKKVQCGPSVLEVLHSAPHGTTIGYEKGDTGWKPLYADSEGEIDQYQRYVGHFHSGGLKFIKDFVERKTRLAPHEQVEPDPEYSNNLLRLVSRPTQDEAAFISLLGLHPDFGASKEMILLIEERGNGSNSMWPIGRSMQYRSVLPHWFDEDQYLNIRPDVLASVQNGEFECGYAHYERYGVNGG